MQVLENDHPGAFGTQAFHEIAELTKHALARSSKNLMLECSTILRAKKARHLRQPRWRVIAKRLEQERPVGSAAQLLQRLDQRQKGFVSSEQLGATTAQHAAAASPH